MIKNLKDFLIGENCSLSKAMKLIQKNERNTIFVTNRKKNKVIGSLTDGDIRRSLIKKNNLLEKVSIICNRNFKFVLDSSNREAALKMFDQKYKLIPVLSKTGKLIEIIDQMEIYPIKKIIIRARAPARISLAGGGTDITSYFLKKGGNGISLTINMFCNVHMVPREDKKIIINSSDFNTRVEFQGLESIIYNGSLDLIKASIKLTQPNFGFEIFVESDVKPGSGLGGSAALSCAVIGAINYLQKRKLGKYEIAELAYQAERIELKIPGGWQDQYSTVFGGCNIMEFSKNRNLVQNLILPNNVIDELERRFILCDTGLLHKGPALQLRNSKNSKLYIYGNEIKRIVGELRKELLKGETNNIGNLIHKTWKIKKKLDSKMTNRKIKHMETRLCTPKLADGCRLLGTGGGGFMLFYVKPQNRFTFIKELKKLKIKNTHIKFDLYGLRVWETNI